MHRHILIDPVTVVTSQNRSWTISASLGALDLGGESREVCAGFNEHQWWLKLGNLTPWVALHRMPGINT